jgi:hypothetical protein
LDSLLAQSLAMDHEVKAQTFLYNIYVVHNGYANSLSVHLILDLIMIHILILIFNIILVLSLVRVPIQVLILILVLIPSLVLSLI